MKKIIIKIFILISFAPIFLTAQNIVAVADSNKADTTFVMKKSAWGAVLRSAIIPGWGQVYNQAYWKAPIVWGVGGWFIYNYIQNNKDYKNYQNLYLEKRIPQDKVNRDFYRDQRDLFAMYFVFTYLATLVDSYVDAHLFDFSVTEDFFQRQPKFNLIIPF